MTDNEFVDSIAHDPIVNKKPDDIKPQVLSLMRRGIAYIHRQMPWHWRKENSSFTLTANTHTVRLTEQCTNPMIYMPKFFWTTNGEIEIWSEKKFRREYPNPELTGTPTIAIPLTTKEFRFYPMPDEDVTIYISYLFVPDNSSIGELPEEFHDILEYYVLMCYERESSKYKELFATSIEAMKSDSKPTEDYSPELYIDDLTDEIRSVQDCMVR